MRTGYAFISGRRSLARIVAITAVTACGDSGMEPDRKPIAVADSLLVASLAGTFEYSDTIAVEWRENGRRGRVMSVQTGTFTATVRAPLAVDLDRHGVDSTWFDTTAAVSFVGIDSFPGFLWLVGDTLVSIGPGASVPREAVADSGVHYSTTALTHPVAVALLVASPIAAQRGAVLGEVPAVPRAEWLEPVVRFVPARPE